jgi:hypothetical protein
MALEILIMMDNNQEEPTILDIAYDLLDTEGPLSPEQMASASRGLGYDIAGWEFQAEIEQHLLIHGDRSPFIEAGTDLYGLWEQIDESVATSYIPQTGHLDPRTRDKQPQQFNFAAAAIGPPPPPPSFQFSLTGADASHAAPRQRHPLEFIFPGAIAIAMASGFDPGCPDGRSSSHRQPQSEYRFYALHSSGQRHTSAQHTSFCCS